MELKILTPLYGGMSLARNEGLFFVKSAIPDETVEARVIEKKKDYAIAETINVVEPSYFRQSPPCPVFGKCGGCHYQFINYEKQLSMKQEIICDCLRRIGKFDVLHFDEAISGEPFHYRKRVQFKIDKNTIGFYRENTHDIVEFDRCLLLDDRLNEVYHKLKQIQIPQEIKDITITAGSNTIAYIGEKDIDEGFLQLLVNENIVNGVVTADKKIGDEYTHFRLGSLTYTVSSWSFLQSNWKMNERITSLLVDNLSADNTTPSKLTKKKKRLLDIYGGGGNFSLPLTHMFHDVTVIEENHFSISDGLRNALINNIKNAHFYHTTFEDAHIRGKYSTVIIDPPRIGISNKSMRKLMQLAPQRLVYISCNPATLSRDAGKLKGMYKLDSIRLVDMFPQTYHCEILCHFSLQ